MKLTSTSAAGEQMRDVEGEAVHHQKLRDTKSSSVASRPSINAAPRNSGTRNTRILAIDGLEQREQEAADARACRDRRRCRSRSATGPAPAGAMPQGTNMQAISET